MKDCPNFSHREVERAGQLIARNFVPTAEVPADIQKAFLVANSWRDSHDYPMRSIRGSVSYLVGRNGLEGITVARLKRMQAIRRKLLRVKWSLAQLQDLGGCRVILPDIASVKRLVQILKEKLPSKVQKEDNYIDKPKDDGYRSHHIIVGFGRPRPTAFDGKKIELQVRTRLQHSWATAVEAVGLYRGEELKNRRGDKDWLRLFVLMSAEFAEAEHCPTPRGVPESHERKSEIKRLAKSLDALGVLESVSNGFRGPDELLAPGYKPSHYLIRYDHENRRVSVEPYNQANATFSYDKAEEQLRSGDERSVVVLVEVDKINNLKAAYPNYFGDVEWFKTQLRQITLGNSAVEYTHAPRPAPARLPPEARIDPRWIRGSRFPRPSLKKIKKKKRR